MRVFDHRQEEFKNVSGGATSMKVDGSSADVTFRVAATAGELWIGTEIVLVISDGDGTGWSTADFAKIASGLSSGCRFRLRDLADTSNLWSFNVQDNFELQMRMPKPDVIHYTNSTVVTYHLTPKGDIGFHVTDNEVLEILVRDDLTSLTKMRAQLNYGVPPA